MASPIILYTAGQASGQTYSGALVNGTTPNIVVSAYTYIELFVQVFSINGGSSPTLQFHVDFQDAFLNWYSSWDGNNYSASTTQLQSFGPGCNVNQLFGDIARVRWSTAGAPTSVVFNVQLIGK